MLVRHYRHARNHSQRISSMNSRSSSLPMPPPFTANSSAAGACAVARGWWFPESTASVRSPVGRSRRPKAIRGLVTRVPLVPVPRRQSCQDNVNRTRGVAQEIGSSRGSHERTRGAAGWLNHLQAHNLKVRGSNPLPATKSQQHLRHLHHRPAHPPGDPVSMSAQCPKNARPRVTASDAQAAVS